MRNLSVLMSLYNESVEEIKQSMDSVLNQTYKDFEFIIINDNPNNKIYDKLIYDYKLKDDRIIYYKNKENIGLALSMNKAAKLAQGNYLARMDADDISLPYRFEKQMLFLENNTCDFVFSNYSIIDEKGYFLNNCEKEQDYYKDNEIPAQIFIKQIIHHPTVIMRKDSFERVGGYRNFICAQDYDLWIRMAEAGIKFHMIDEILLYYRIRANSITSKKLHVQLLTVQYIYKLLMQRLNYSNDSYDYNEYCSYINAKSPQNDNEIRNLWKAQVLLKKAKNCNSIIRLLIRIYVFCFSKIHRDIFLQKQYRKILLNKFLKKCNNNQKINSKS